MIPTREVNYNSPSFISGVEYGAQQLKTLLIEDYKRSKTGLVGAANRYFKLSEENLSKRILQSEIPHRRRDGTQDKRYKKYKSVAKLFDEARLAGTGKVRNIYLLRILKKQVNYRGCKRKVNTDDYRNKKKSYNQKLENSLKFLNARWTTIGYKIRFHSDYCELVSLNQKVAP